MSTPTQNLALPSIADLVDPPAPRLRSTGIDRPRPRSSNFNPDQLDVARQIYDIGRQRGESDDAIRAALSTGIVESNYNPQATGDQGSAIGVFQQRRQGGYDTSKSRDVGYAANAFYDNARGVKSYNSPGHLAAQVQRPRSDLRGRYDEELPRADALFQQFGGAQSAKDQSLNLNGIVEPPTQTKTPQLNLDGIVDSPAAPTPSNQGEAVGAPTLPSRGTTQSPATIRGGVSDTQLPNREREPQPTQPTNEFGRMTIRRPAPLPRRGQFTVSNPDVDLSTLPQVDANGQTLPSQQEQVAQMARAAGSVTGTAASNAIARQSPQSGSDIGGQGNRVFINRHEPVAAPLPGRPVKPPEMIEPYNPSLLEQAGQKVTDVERYLGLNTEKGIKITPAEEAVRNAIDVGSAGIIRLPHVQPSSFMPEGEAQEKQLIDMGGQVGSVAGVVVPFMAASKLISVAKAAPELASLVSALEESGPLGRAAVRASEGAATFGGIQAAREATNVPYGESQGAGQAIKNVAREAGVGAGSLGLTPSGAGPVRAAGTFAGVSALSDILQGKPGTETARDALQNLLAGIVMHRDLPESVKADAKSTLDSLREMKAEAGRAVDSAKPDNVVQRGIESNLRSDTPTETIAPPVSARGTERGVTEQPKVSLNVGSQVTFDWGGERLHGKVIPLEVEDAEFLKERGESLNEWLRVETDNGSSMLLHTDSRGVRPDKSTEVIPYAPSRKTSSAQRQNALVGAEDVGGTASASAGDVPSSAGDAAPPVRHVDVQRRYRRNVATGNKGQFKEETNAESEARRTQVAGNGLTESKAAAISGTGVEAEGVKPLAVPSDDQTIPAVRMKVSDIKDAVQNHLEELFSRDEVDVRDIAVIGSHAKGTAKPGSDLDVLVEYGGTEDAREDDVFNHANSEGNALYLNGVKVDINPVRADDSGTLDEWLGRHGYTKEATGETARTSEALGLEGQTVEGSEAQVERPGTDAKVPVESEAGTGEKDATQPNWVKQNLDALTADAERKGIANKIEDLAVQRKTAKEIARQLGTDTNTVRAVRAKRGIPRMDDKAAFEAWLSNKTSVGGTPVKGEEGAGRKPENLSLTSSDLDLDRLKRDAGIETPLRLSENNAGKTHILPGGKPGTKFVEAEERRLAEALRRQGYTATKRTSDSNFNDKTLSEGGGWRIHGTWGDRYAAEATGPQAQGRAKVEKPSFKEARRTPKGGAVAAGPELDQATAAEALGRKFGLRPEKVYDWAVRHGVNLAARGSELSKSDSGLLDAVLNDKPLKALGVKEPEPIEPGFRLRGKREQSEPSIRDRQRGAVPESSSERVPIVTREGATRRASEDVSSPEVGAQESRPVDTERAIDERPLRRASVPVEEAAKQKRVEPEGASAARLRPNALSAEEPGRIKERSLPKTLEGSELPKGTDLTYEEKTNVRSGNAARDRIQRMGEKGATDWVLAGDKPSVEQSATAVELIKTFANSGDAAKLERAVTIADEMSRKTTEAGQFNQYFATLAKESPDGAVMAAQRAVTRRGGKLTPEESQDLVDTATRLQKAEAKNAEHEKAISDLQKQLTGAKANKSQTFRQRGRVETLVDRLSKAETEARARIAETKRKSAQPTVNAITGELIDPNRSGERGGVGLSKARENFRPATEEDKQSLKIPPAWTDVHVSADPEARLLAVGRDGKGRTQRLYSAAHTEAQLVAKFERGREFNDALPDIMARIEQDARGGSNKEEAAVLRLIAHTGFRVGSSADTLARVKAYGASTLRAEHVKTDGDTASFDFTGKLGVRQQHSVTDADLANDLRERSERGGPLFRTTDSKVRDYLHSIGGAQSFKIHDFRTWNATDAARQAIEQTTPPLNPEEYWRKRDAIGDIAATKIGDTRQIALETYVDPLVFENWREGAGVAENATRPKQIGRRAASQAGNIPAETGTDAGVLRDASLRQGAGPAGRTQRLQDRLAQIEAAARGRLEARKASSINNPQAGASAIPLDIADYAIVGASKLARKSVRFAEWADDMVRDFGEQIRPHLNAIYKESYRLYSDEKANLERDRQERGVRRENKGTLKPEDIERLIAERRTKQRQARMESSSARADLQRKFRDVSRTRGQRALAKTGQTLSTLNRNALLTVRGAGRILGGMTGKQAADTVGDMIAAPVDAVVSKVRGTPRSIARLTVPGLTRASINGATEGAQNALLALRGKETQFSHAEEPLTGLKPVDTAVNLMQRIYSAKENFIRSYAYNKSIETQARTFALNDLKEGKIAQGELSKRTEEYKNNPPPLGALNALVAAERATAQANYDTSMHRLDGLTTPAREAKFKTDLDALMNSVALRESDEQVYAEPSEIADRMRGARRAPPTTTTGKVLQTTSDVARNLYMPFMRRPSNALVDFLQTYVGAPFNIPAQAWRMRGAEFPAEAQARFSKSVGRGLVGYSLLGLGGVLASEGRMTGMYNKDEKNRGSLIINGQAYPVWKVPFVGWLLTLGATVHESGLKVAPGAMGKMIIEHPFLRGIEEAGGTLDNLKNAVRDGDKMGEAFSKEVVKTGGQFASRLVPQPLPTIAEASDSKERVTNENIYQPTISRIPFARQTLTPFADKSKASIVDPFYSSPRQPPSSFRSMFGHQSEGFTELQRLGMDLRGVQQKRGESGSDYLKRKAEINPKIGKAVDEQVRDPAYKNATNEEKHKILREVEQSVIKAWQ